MRLQLTLCANSSRNFRFFVLLFYFISRVVHPL